MPPYTPEGGSLGPQVDFAGVWAWGQVFCVFVVCLEVSCLTGLSFPWSFGQRGHSLLGFLVCTHWHFRVAGFFKSGTHEAKGNPGNSPPVLPWSRGPRPASSFSPPFRVSLCLCDTWLSGGTGKSTPCPSSQQWKVPVHFLKYFFSLLFKTDYSY